jgi:hypothetical protein
MDSIIPAPRSGLKGRNNPAQGIALGFRPKHCRVAMKGQNKIADFGGGAPAMQVPATALAKMPRAGFACLAIYGGVIWLRARLGSRSCCA